MYSEGVYEGLELPTLQGDALSFSIGSDGNPGGSRSRT